MKDCTICGRQLCADPTTCRGELAALLARMDEPRAVRRPDASDFWGDGWTLSVDEYRARVEQVRRASIRQAEIRAGFMVDDCDPHGIARPLMVVAS